MDRVIPEVVDCMTPGPHVVGPDDTLRRAEELMLENGIRHLPVVTVAGGAAEFVAVPAANCKNRRRANVMVWPPPSDWNPSDCPIVKPGRA